jgi:hypothetical protein
VNATFHAPSSENVVSGCDQRRSGGKQKYQGSPQKPRGKTRGGCSRLIDMARARYGSDRNDGEGGCKPELLTLAASPLPVGSVPCRVPCLPVTVDFPWTRTAAKTQRTSKAVKMTMPAATRGLKPVAVSPTAGGVGVVDDAMRRRTPGPGDK